MTKEDTALWLFNNKNEVIRILRMSGYTNKEDIIQAAILRILKNNLASHTNVKQLVLSCVYSTLLNTIRKNKKYIYDEYIEDKELPSEDCPYEAIEQRQRVQYLLTQVDQLPKAQQQALKDFYFKDINLSPVHPKYETTKKNRFHGIRSLREKEGWKYV